ncbi:MAG: hypothetical protein GX256_09695 [Fretibacterium sp.]|nr:hypothetical protein [Fretibacterium sp.]
MQVNGAADFFSRIASLGRTGTTAWERLRFNTPTAQGNVDTVSLSDIGKRLSFHRSESLLGNGGKTGPTNTILALMDKSMSDVESILNKMNSLAEDAGKEGLSDLDRINKQIEMEELRARLYSASKSMTHSLAKMSGQETSGELTLVEASPGIWGGDHRTLLERARDRIENGEEWDVVEGYRYLHTIEEVRIGGTDRSIKIEKGERFELPDDIDPENAVLCCIGTPAGGEWFVCDGDSDTEGALSVRQKIQASGTINLMDAKSAQEGLARLKVELRDMKSMREKLTAFIKGCSAEDMTQTFGGDVSGGKGFLFNTVLGVMKTQTVTGLNATPKLVRPTSCLGEMFARVDSFLQKVARNLAEHMIAEAVQVTDAGYTNADRFVSSRKV